MEKQLDPLDTVFRDAMWPKSQKELMWDLVERFEASRLPRSLHASVKMSSGPHLFSLTAALTSGEAIGWTSPRTQSAPSAGR